MDMARDLRQAARSLTRRPGFTIIAVLALALGIGANTAIFSVVEAVLLEPLPFDEPGRLVVVREREMNTDRPPEDSAAATIADWREQSRTFEALGAWIYWGLALTGTGEPVEIDTVRVSANLFPLLGAEPAIGRSFTAEEEQAGRDRVVILSHGMWQSRFAGDPAVIGRTLTLDGLPHVVVGVMPREFRFPDDDNVGLWMPLAYKPHEVRSRYQRMFNVIGRLASGVTLDQARTEMRTIARRLAEQFPETNANWTVELQPAREVVVGSARQPLLLLLGAVGLVLLIACANVASLFLARVADREREIAIRGALGAGRGRVVRYLLTEALLVAVAGAVLGLLLAYGSVSAIATLDPGHLPAWNAIEIDGRVLGFTAAIAALTALTAGLVPALTGSRLRTAEILKNAGERATSARGAVRLRKLLIVAEVGLAIVLLLGAGLLMRSFWRVMNEDPGFRPDNLLAMTLYLPENRYSDDEAIQFFEELLDRLRTLPGATAAGGVTTLPMSPVGIDHDMPFWVDGTPSAVADPRPQADYRITTNGYFQAIGVPLLAGRVFDERDRRSGRNVVVINRTLAERYIPGANPIGKTLRWGGDDSPTPAEIVGVVGDVRHRGLDSEPRPEIYVPQLQLPYSYGMFEIVVRTRTQPLALAEAVKGEVFALDPGLPVSELTTMNNLLTKSTQERRFNLVLLGTFAALALVLAAIGVYSVVSYSVALRTREIGLRIALGACRADVIRLVLRDGLVLAGAGTALGTLAAVFVTRLLGGLLYDIDPVDPLTFIAVPLVLLAITLAACGLPARRAGGLDPVRALADDR